MQCKRKKIFSTLKLEVKANFLACMFSLRVSPSDRGCEIHLMYSNERTILSTLYKDERRERGAGTIGFARELERKREERRANASVRWKRDERERGRK